MIEILVDKVNDKNLIERLFAVVSKTLGNTVEQGIKIKFDFELAKNSIRFYNVRSISKIEEINIPQQVTELKYKSDLTNVAISNPKKDFKNDGELFESL